MSGKRCKICERTNPSTKLTYSIVQGDDVCLQCYKDQFPQRPFSAYPFE